MSWAKLDDGFYDHPKVIKAGLEAAGLYCLCLSYSSRHSTDGYLEAAVLEMLSHGRSDLVTKLVAVGLFDAAESGVVIHDFLTYNPSSKEVAKRRKGQRIRTAKHRTRNAVGNALQPEASNALLRDGSGRDGTGSSSSSVGKGKEREKGEGFRVFYDAYPRHEKATDAERAYEQVRDELPPNLLEIVAAQKANNFAGRAKQHIPLPGTWLRGRQWTDEITPAVTGGHHGGPNSARTRTSEDPGKWAREAARDARIVTLGAPGPRGAVDPLEAGSERAGARPREAATSGG